MAVEKFRKHDYEPAPAIVNAGSWRRGSPDPISRRNSGATDFPRPKVSAIIHQVSDFAGL
jgi:hypothetical protein